MAHRPTFVAKGTFASGTGAIIPGLPAGIRNRDLMLLFVESANQAIATPTGWTQVPTVSPQFTGTAAAAGGVRLAVFYKLVLGTEIAPSVADTGNHTTAIIIAVRGVNMANLINASVGAVDSAATSAIAYRGVTTTKDDCFIVHAIGLDQDIAGTAQVGAPSNANLTSLTEQHDQTVALGVGGGLAIVTGYRDVAGATGNTTATGAASTTHAYITLALEPNDPLVLTDGQYDNDETTVIAVGGSTTDGTANATPVLLRSEFSQGNPLDQSATLNLEVDPIATAFANTASHSRTVKQKTSDVRSNRRGGSMVYDDVNKRLIFFGGYDGTTRYNDIWEQYTNVPGQPWRKITPTGTAPSGRNMAGSCVVKGNLTTGGALRSYLIIWGGAVPDDSNDMYALRIDTPGSEAWTTITQTGAPAVRAYITNSLVSAPVSGASDQNHIYLFGGWGAARLNDLQRCTFDVDTPTAVTWTALRADGNVTGPTRRSGAILGYKASTNKLYAFGGFNGTTYLSEFWEYDIVGDTWTNTAPTGVAPLGREMGAGGYDSTNNRFWYAGGWDGTTGPTTMNDIGYINDVGGAESYVEVRAMSRAASNAGGDHSYPPNALSANCMLTDRGLLVQDGMFTYDSTERYLLAIDLNDGVTSDKPVYGISDGEYFNSRDAASSLLNPVDNKWLIIAGFDDMDDDTTIARGTHSSDVWAYDPVNNRWTYSNKGYLAIPPSEGRYVCYDTTRNRVLLFGGLSGVAQVTNEVWSLERDANGLYKAKRLNPTGTPPSARWLGASAYDAVNDRMIVTMGRNDTTLFNDTYALSFSGGADGAWSTLSPTGTPPVVAWQPAFFNKTGNNRLYIFGGGTNTGDTTYSAQLLYLDYTNPVPVWNTPTSSAGTARRGAGFAHDTTNDKLLVFGGWNGAVIQALQWWDVVAGGAWVTPTISGSQPDGRRSLGGMFHSGKFYITCGRPGTGMWYSDTWELTPNYGTPNSSTWLSKAPRIFNTAHIAFSTGSQGTSYHWQSWLNETTGESAKVSFGGNAETVADFIINAAVTTFQITKQLIYRVKTTPTALTKSLSYRVKTTPSALTKGLEYRIRRTQTAITKSLSYMIRKPIAITKSLAYTIKSTALAITKSLVYRIKTTPTAITKSLMYRLRVAISITKSLQYTVKVTVSAITKSLTYRVKTSPSAITKSLRYALKTSPSAITRVLIYRIKAPIAITKSLTYRIKTTPVAVTKSLVYRVVSVTSTNVTKTLQYAIRKNIAITKSLQYTVKAVASITKSLRYAVKSSPSAINKGLSYRVKSPVAITKSLVYKIKTSPSAITKSLRYAIRIVPVAITKSLQYFVRKNLALTKSLRYAVRPTIAITKSLRYTTKAPVAIAKALAYRIKTTPSALTKSMAYYVRKSTAIAKGLVYTIKKANSITKSLNYIVANRITVTKSLTYTVKAPVALTKSLVYRVRTTPTAITKSLVYRIRASASIIKSLAYKVKAPVAITRSLKYTIVRPATAITKSLVYRVRTTPSVITKSLTYRVRTTVVAITKSMRYAIRLQGAITKGLVYTIKASVAITKSLKYTVRTTASAITKSLLYKVKTPAGITKSLRYAIRSSATAITKSLVYRIRIAGAVTKSLRYSVKAPVAITKSLKYTVFKALSVTKSLQYNISSNSVVIAKSLKYTIKQTPSALIKSLRYTVLSAKVTQKQLRYSLSQPAILTRALTYSVGNQISESGRLILSRRQDSTVIRPHETITTLSIETPRANVLNNKDNKTILK